MIIAGNVQNKAKDRAFFKRLKRAIDLCVDAGAHPIEDYDRKVMKPILDSGNPWFISTLWLGEYFIERAETRQEVQDALPYLEWCVNNALPSGVFAEQVHPVSGAPLCVSPLTWSHSAFIWTVLRYTEKRQQLTS